MYDVVIPLRDTPSLYNDLELTYCLRSIEKFFPVRDVWCVGIPRDWLSVSWIEQGDLPGAYDSRHESVRQKILRACESPFISDPFALWNDDFFLLREIDELHDYYDGTIEQRLTNTGSGYRQAMERTVPYADGRNYEVHAPLLVDKKMFKRVTKPNMLYRNLYCSASQNDKIEMKDCKLYNRADHEYFRDFTRDRWMFSTSEFSFALLKRQMDRLYPDESRWE